MPPDHPVDQPPLPPTLVQRVRAKARELPAWARVVAHLRSRRATELWIGDSHAMTFLREERAGMFQRGPGGRLILRAGARLMWSLATKGFPARVLRVVRVIERFARPGAFVPVFVSGEIDIRAHLVSRPTETFDFVQAYVARCMDLAHQMHAQKVGFAVPPPPSDMADEVWFPMIGTIAERVAVFQELRIALRTALASHPDAVLLDFTDLLEDEAGGLRREFTDDGCHTNSAALALIRHRIAQTEPLSG